MLFVKARPSSSSIHGLGLFAEEFIPRETVLWKFHPGFDLAIPEESLATLPLWTQERVRHYAYFCSRRHEYLLSADDDRFTNHSDKPNSHFDGERSIALRDIFPGEEITIDYRDLGIDPPASNSIVTCANILLQ